MKEQKIFQEKELQPQSLWKGQLISHILPPEQALSQLLSIWYWLNVPSSQS
jgi:hypothetical protein